MAKNVSFCNPEGAKMTPNHSLLLRPLCNNKLSSQTSGSLEHISRLLLSMPQLRPRTAPYGRDSNQRHKHHGICCSKISLPYL
ncbi:unnamed protein product [Bursaphelenchus xylophilus]|uniref:(pine wood nematode) hypothetical protein n=1 Tax=Bursaphelenchus xylophilus TaxID=6326 RepID=A0A811M513_BURXY|nr:unnamed protein product [Bursaphelenchus xylophilus]CAG9132685.1 unnamed protein product [Bursaphelenchus xylophilus]